MLMTAIHTEPELELELSRPGESDIAACRGWRATS